MVEHVKLPQWVSAVNQLAMQLSGGSLGFFHRHGCVDGADMARDVEVFIGYPQWVPQVQRHEHELAREDGRQVDALSQVPSDILVKVAAIARWQFV